MDKVVADDIWASLLTDLLLDIFRRLETTAVIRCAGTCKPWRRTIISNASILRPCPDRFNPNLLLGFFHARLDHAPPRVIVSFTAVDTGHCERLSSLIPATSAGGVDLSVSDRILSSCDGFLLLLLRPRLIYYELCLCNPIAQDCTFLPLPPLIGECEYTLLTGTRDDHGAVRILATLSTEEDRRLTYMIFSCSHDGAGPGIWGPLQSSEVVNKEGLRRLTYGLNAVVVRDAVYWLAGPRNSGWRITCTVGLDIYTGRACATQLPSQCHFLYDNSTAYALTTTGNGRLSLLQPLSGHLLQVWVLEGDDFKAMEWTMQHKISVDVKNPLGDGILRCHYSNVTCPRSGFLFIVLYSNQQLRINLDSRARQPVQGMGKRDRFQYYPYEMDWSTYISNMKIF